MSAVHDTNQFVSFSMHRLQVKPYHCSLIQLYLG